MHPYCTTREPFGGYKTPVTLQPINCKFCREEFQPKYKSRQVCSKECLTNLWKTNEYKEMAKKNGEKVGRVSATKQSRRSKNEVYFAELCQQYFTITTNHPFFDGWDTDVIIHDDKIAVLWNGPWYYTQISKTQSLAQIQTKDKVKTSIINKYDYTPFVIKDIGKHNKKFVEQEFEIFMLMRMASRISIYGA